MGVCINVRMPNKTIYIADADLPIADRAAELAGGLSPAVIEALRLYVETAERRQEGFEEIRVDTRVEGKPSAKVFSGRHLARVIESYDGHSLRWTTYITPKDRIVVVARDEPDIVGVAKGAVEHTADNVTRLARDVETGLRATFEGQTDVAKEHWRVSAAKWVGRGWDDATSLIDPRTWDAQRWRASENMHIFDSVGELRDAVMARREFAVGSESRYIPMRLIDATQDALGEEHIEIMDI